MLSAAQSIASRAPLAARPRQATAQPRRPVQTQALFGFLAPSKPKAGPNKSQELVDQLLELTERTDGGLNASPAKREQIAALVEELEAYCPRNPLRSPLLYGDYEVLYASKPQTAGGPFRSPVGRTVFPGQRATQSIQEPNICINEVSYKTLGFLPGRARQEGEIEPINSTTFQLTFPELDGKAKGGPPQRIIQIAYLDERIRVARAIPPEDREDQEGSFYVFRRIVEEEEVEEEEEAPAPAPKRAPFGTRKIKAQAQQEVEEAAAAAPKRGGLLGTQLLGRKEGLATIAERRYAQQQGSRGTGARAAGTQGRGGSQATGTQARKSREEIAAERAAARAQQEEERRRAKEAAAAAKAAAEEERRRAREQQEAERARQAELRERAKEQLAQLQGEAAEAADAAKEAASAVKDAEKAAAELLKEASRARLVIDQAAEAAAAAAEEAENVKQQEKEAAAAVAEARAVLKQLETAARRK
ncbi:hypothetical protein ABPG77_009019 [Micractinium sp. CCAP 211/92]